jgi:tRNA pseudouridine55 synthase
MTGALPPQHASTPPPTPAGVLLIDKAPGFTSMDVCAIVRTKFRRGGAPKRIKVGHGGTLDPMATGLLVVLVGKATKMCEEVMVGEKEYITTLDLARTSSTDDAEGELRDVAVLEPPTRAHIEKAIASQVGTILQRPPHFSAIHVGGQRAYDLARQGKLVELAARPVVIHSIEILRYEWPSLELRVVCGKGVYIRSIARDLGVALGTGGMLTALRRTRTGKWSLQGSRSVKSLPDTLGQQDLARVE